MTSQPTRAEYTPAPQHNAHMYALDLKVTDLQSIRKEVPRMGYSSIVLQLADGGVTLAPLYFHSGYRYRVVAHGLVCGGCLTHVGSVQFANRSLFRARKAIEVVRIFCASESIVRHPCRWPYHGQATWCSREMHSMLLS